MRKQPARKPSAASLAKRLSTAWRARSEIKKELRKPASAARIAKTEAKLGVKLPRALVELYKLHDGTGYAGIDGYYWLLSLDGMVNAWKIGNDLQEHGDFDGWHVGEWWNASWIPFADFDPDMLCWDSATGDVVEFLAYDNKRWRLHESADQWLLTVTELTEQARDAEDLTEFMTFRQATRIRKELNPGYPIRRSARKQRAPRYARKLRVEQQVFERGPYEWTIERAGPFVQTSLCRSHSVRSWDKGFPDEERAVRYRDRMIQKKLEEGYKARGPMTTWDGTEHFLEAAHRHLRTLGKKR